jgi:signal transduction histidine kinase
MSLENLAQFMQMQFMHVADEKGLEFQIKLAENLPPSIESDQQRVQQILKNLLSNAFKFTSQGSVGLYIERPAAGTDLGAIGCRPSGWLPFA